MSTPLPTPSIPDSPRHNAPHPSRTSIALIAASLFSFALFVFLSIHRRPSRDPLPPTPPSETDKPSTRSKPKLWEVCLDEDHHRGRGLTRPDGAVRNWQPIAAWTDNHRLGRLPRSRQASAPRALPEQEQAMDHHVEKARAWFRSTYPLSPRRPTQLPAPRPPASSPILDHRTLNVAVLVAMPSRRLQMHGTTPHHPIGSRLSYGEGQLSIGTTGLSFSEYALPTATLAEHELEQTT